MRSRSPVRLRFPRLALAFVLAGGCAASPSTAGRVPAGDELDAAGGTGGTSAPRGGRGGADAEADGAASPTGRDSAPVLVDAAADLAPAADTGSGHDTLAPRDTADAAPALDAADAPRAMEDPGALARALATKGELYVSLDDPRTQTTFPEGVSWRRDGSLFVCASKLTRIAPDRKKFHYLDVGCLGTYGLAEDRLLVAGAQGLYLIDASGKVAVLAETGGANDVSVDKQGRAYFTVGGAIRRASPDGTLENLGGGGANGVEIDPTDRYVYATLSGQGSIVRYDLPATGGRLGGPTTLFTGLPTPDGIAVDAAGRLWVALHASLEIGVFDPAKKAPLGRIKVPLMYSVQNLAFGDAGFDTLYVAGGRFGANSQIWRFPVGIAGFRNPGAASYRAARTLGTTAADVPY